MNLPSTNRIVFLDHLRAIACLLVVLGHVYFMGFNGFEAIKPYVPSVTANIFGPDAAQRNVLTGPSLYMAIDWGVNVGALGVSLFFLISGFVILRAVERESVASFLVRRVFRIYPVSIAAVAITGAITAWYCIATDTVSPHTLSSMVSSAFILNGFLHLFETVPVLWSLEVELFFYVFMAVLAMVKKLDCRALMVLGLANLVFCLVANTTWVVKTLPPSIVQVLVHLSFVCLQTTFLLVGSMIYRLATDGFRLQSWFYLGLSLVVFAAARIGYLRLFGRDSGGVDFPSAAWSLLIFSLAMTLRVDWRWLRPLAFVGDISYPLYLIHIPTAWIALAYFAGRGWGMLASGLASGMVVMGLAWITHVAVENPARDFGKRLIRNRRSPKPADVIQQS